MLRTSLPLNYIKRTFRPLYGWTQATPKSGFLDPTWNRSVAIFPGMVVTKTTGNNYTLAGFSTGTTVATSTDLPAGFIAQFVGGNGVDELLEAGINAIGVWELGPDAEFEVLAPAFDPTLTWAETPGTDTLIGVSVGSGSAGTAAYNQGQLIPWTSGTASTTVTTTNGNYVVSSKPIARLIQVESPSSIVIGGLQTGVR